MSTQLSRVPHDVGPGRRRAEQRGWEPGERRDRAAPPRQCRRPASAGALSPDRPAAGPSRGLSIRVLPGRRAAAAACLARVSAESARPDARLDISVIQVLVGGKPHMMPAVGEPGRRQDHVRPGADRSVSWRSASPNQPPASGHAQRADQTGRDVARAGQVLDDRALSGGVGQHGYRDVATRLPDEST